MLIPSVEKEKRQVKIGDIQFRSEIYARFEPNQRLLNDYEENIEEIINSDNYIQVSKDLTLIDGYHRWKAAERVYGKEGEITVIVHDTNNNDYIELTSYAANTRHGKRNSKQENKRNVRRLYVKGFTLEQIQDALGLGQSLIYESTKEDRAREKEERQQTIVDMYLQAWNTQRSIAEAMGETHQSISNIINLAKDSTCGKFCQTFEPFIYNIWNLQKAEKETAHFGHFPQVFMDNLLYYHTNPLDIVYDPFAGDGTTVDSCRYLFRRYYCSDRKVKPGRERDIIEHNIQDGLPANLQKPDLLFLDPPYWKLAKKEYSEDETDLGNMTYEEFINTIHSFVKLLVGKKVKRIAYLIRPIYDDGFEWRDPLFELHSEIQDKYKIENRYVLPYSTQQYTGLWVDRAKKAKKTLILNRELIVWVKNG